MLLREASAEEVAVSMEIERRAFGQDSEADLVAALLADPTAEPRLSLLAIEGARPVGHILFTAVTIAGAGEPVTSAILCPLAVLPEAQASGCGSALIRDGLARLGAGGTGLVFVLGDPGYYNRFGFEAAGRHGLTAPYPIPDEHADAWMVQALQAGLLGRVHGEVRCAESLQKPEYWQE